MPTTKHIFYLLCFCLTLTIILLSYTHSEHLVHYIPKKLDFTFSSVAVPSKLLNITFKYKHLPNACDKNDFYVTLVHTSPDHLENRDAIRETWGQRSLGVNVYFLLGISPEVNQSIIDSEVERYHDIIQGDFIDSYQNLSYKHVMGLKYTSENCPNVKYVLKVDDDTYINTPNMKEFLDLFHYKHADSTSLICNVMDYSPVLREGKWGVSEESFPEKFYPTYCSGFAVIYPAEAARRIYDQSKEVNEAFLWVDDAFVTGVLAAKAGIKHTSFDKLYLSHNNVTQLMKEFNEFGGRPFLVGRMNLSTMDIRTLWKFLKDHIPKASILDLL